MSASDPSTRGTIGPYRIVARVGAGGMGEVFKAWDPRLERDVAIKVLHADGGLDPDRQRRLLAEGRAASALNHPNILRVYEAAVEGSLYYLVSEWLDGKSLRDELARGPLPVKRLLDLSLQIADGLAAAHALGIVHRDIKPENVMLARDGTARIVDFGLARSDPHSPALSSVVGHATTVSLEGGISGTPAYMSPEQARGNAGDFRSDQFSFGALLYEMAAGTFAFRRDSMADTLSAVLHEDPRPIGELNPRVPAAFRWVIEQCLAKDVSERYTATDDLARELRRVRDRWREAEAKPIDPAAERPRRRWLSLAAGAAFLAALMFVIGLSLRSPEASPTSFVPFASASSYEGSPAWSADGQTLAYVADVDGVLQVFVKRLGDALPHQVTQGRFDAQEPFWAPSGQQLYFISLAGERPALWSVGVAGGKPELVIENVTHAAIDPSGQRLAMMRDNPDSLMRFSFWWSMPPGSPPTKESRPPFDRLESTASHLSFSADGQLLVWTSGISGLMIDGMPVLNQFHLFGAAGEPPRRVLINVENPTNLPSFGWLPDNRHVMLALPDRRLGNRHLWLADTRSDAMTQITSTHTNETSPAVASVGGRAAYATDEVDFDVTLLSPDGRTRRSMLATARNEFSPAWSPSGDQFAFVTDRSGRLEIWTRSRDGQWERPIVTPDDFGASRTESMGALAFSPDGRTLAYQRSAEGAFEIWLSPVTGGTPERAVRPEPGYSLPYQDSPSWSPDGEWLAFTETSGESGQRQGMRKVRVGTKESVLLLKELASFSQTRWSPDGRWIICQTFEGLTLVPSDGGAPTVIAPDSYLDFTWSPDGRQVYALADSDTSGHFALIEIDVATRAIKDLNPDLGSIPVANQPIRGFSFVKGQGFLTSLASARSDIWLLEGFQPPSRWADRLFRRVP